MYAHLEESGEMEGQPVSSGDIRAVRVKCLKNEPLNQQRFLQSDWKDCILIGKNIEKPRNNAADIPANKKAALLNAGPARLMMIHSFLVPKINMITCILKLIQTHW